MSLQIGHLGEDKASSYLIENNYKILERNVFLHWGEIDIIAEKNNTLFFVEVKSCFDYSKVSPIDNMSKNKIRHLLRSIQLYLVKNKISNRKYKLSLIAIIFSNDKTVSSLKFYDSLDICNAGYF